jgi:hypothetical protein
LFHIFAYGQTDLIVCSSEGGNESEHHEYTKQFFEFCKTVMKLNNELKQHKSLLYLIETTYYGRTDEQCSCRCNSRVGKGCDRTIICNWSLDKEASSLKELNASVNLTVAETSLGLPDQYVSSSGTCFITIESITEVIWG